MNTVKKGDLFEKKVFDYFQTEINEDRFYAKKEFCRIYSKKGFMAYMSNGLPVDGPDVRK